MTARATCRLTWCHGSAFPNSVEGVGLDPVGGLQESSRDRVSTIEDGMGTL